MIKTLRGQGPEINVAVNQDALHASIAIARKQVHRSELFTFLSSDARRSEFRPLLRPKVRSDRSYERAQFRSNAGHVPEDYQD